MFPKRNNRLQPKSAMRNQSWRSGQLFVGRARDLYLYVTWTGPYGPWFVRGRARICVVCFVHGVVVKTLGWLRMAEAG